jgi:hypothetical protein
MGDAARNHTAVTAGKQLNRLPARCIATVFFPSAFLKLSGQWSVSYMVTLKVLQTSGCWVNCAVPPNEQEWSVATVDEVDGDQSNTFEQIYLGSISMNPVSAL